MQRGSDVWAWTGFDTAFERGKVDRIEAHKGVIHVKLDKGGKMFECKDDTVHLANHQNQDGVADNTELRQLNEATLLHNIRSRYTKDEAGCYTVTGHILIAVNPFKQLTIYDEKQVRSFPGPICVRAPPSTSRASILSAVREAHTSETNVHAIDRPTKSGCSMALVAQTLSTEWVEPRSWWRGVRSRAGFATRSRLTRRRAG